MLKLFYYKKKTYEDWPLYNVKLLSIFLKYAPKYMDPSGNFIFYEFFCISNFIFYLIFCIQGGDQSLYVQVAGWICDRRFFLIKLKNTAVTFTKYEVIKLYFMYTRIKGLPSVHRMLIIHIKV